MGAGRGARKRNRSTRCSKGNPDEHTGRSEDDWFDRGRQHRGTVAKLAVAAGYQVVLSNSRGPETLASFVAELVRKPVPRPFPAAAAGIWWW